MMTDLDLMTTEDLITEVVRRQEAQGLAYSIFLGLENGDFWCYWLNIEFHGYDDMCGIIEEEFEGQSDILDTDNWNPSQEELDQFKDDFGD